MIYLIGAAISVAGLFMKNPAVVTLGLTGMAFWLINQREESDA